MTRFWNNLHQVRSNQKIGNQIIVFESNENEYFNINKLLTDLMK